jgi:protein-L-isoaspartate O-methyltransferase
MNLDGRRIRMVMELRRLGVTDPRVLGAMERCPREDF